MAGMPGTGDAQSPAGERVVPPVRFAPLQNRATNSTASGQVVPSLLPELDPPSRASSPPLPPGVPPLGLPSDGEAAPPFPDLPDLPGTSVPTPESPPLPVDSAATSPERNAVNRVDPAPPSEMPGQAIWHRSPREAREIAAHEHRCHLLVMTASHSVVDAASRALNEEVFATDEFNEFAMQHLVLSSLDYTRRSSLPDQAALAREDLLKKFKDHLKVRGLPTVILFGPDGREMTRWSGYPVDPKTGKGRSAQYFQTLKNAVLGHEAMLFANERRREKLTEQGYREWTSLQGTSVFAKLVEFDAHRAVLRDENGQERKVELRQLDIADREIITRKRLGKMPVGVQ